MTVIFGEGFEELWRMMFSETSIHRSTMNAGGTLPAISAKPLVSPYSNSSSPISLSNDFKNLAIQVSTRVCAVIPTLLETKV
jgi:hypothetical protein